MKAALIIMERYPDTGITFVPENVNALVTPGLTRDPITLPAVERVIGYVIWRYIYNDKGLKTKEALFDKEQQLTGKIEYSYIFGQ